MAIGTENESHLNALQAKNGQRDNLVIQAKDDKAAVTTICECAFDLDALHNVLEPKSPKPAPADLSHIPTRYPETLGTLVEIRESEGKGLGMFAMKDILPGTFLLCEIPLLVMVKTDTIHSLTKTLSLEGKKKLMSLSAFNNEETALSEEEHLAIIENCNSFEMIEGKSGFFETASRINHSCVPNSSYRWRESIGRLAVWNRFKLLEGEEVSIDYGHGRRVLRSNYGFECDCGGCSEVELESDGETQGDEYGLDHAWSRSILEDCKENSERRNSI
jgi:hypothetical protein